MNTFKVFNDETYCLRSPSFPTGQAAQIDNAKGLTSNQEKVNTEQPYSEDFDNRPDLAFHTSKLIVNKLFSLSFILKQRFYRNVDNSLICN